MYSTHGYMTPADMQDYRELYDWDTWKDDQYETCPGHETVAEGKVVAVTYCKAGHLCEDEL